MEDYCCEDGLRSLFRTYLMPMGALGQNCGYRSR